MTLNKSVFTSVNESQLVQYYIIAIWIISHNLFLCCFFLYIWLKVLVLLSNKKLR